MANLTLQGKVIIKGRIKAETGLHIGGGDVGLNIGGVDNAVIYDANGKPYIPGSSLRGKLRSLLERSEGLSDDGNRVYTKKPEISMHMCNDPNCVVCNIFGRNNVSFERAPEGSTGDCSINPSAPNCPNNKSGATLPKCKYLCIENTTPTRLIIRDAELDEATITDEMKKNMDLEWTEVKFENSIDRVTSAANPRQTERVPAGAEFEFEMVYNIFNNSDKNNLKKVFKAMELLEHDYLGGQGSRGYGKISFKNIEVYHNSRTDYENGTIELTPERKINTLTNVSQIVSNFNDVIASKI
jgi:CRISPR-associated protein Csm3